MRFTIYDATRRQVRRGFERIRLLSPALSFPQARDEERGHIARCGLSVSQTPCLVQRAHSRTKTIRLRRTTARQGTRRNGRFHFWFKIINARVVEMGFDRDMEWRGEHVERYQKSCSRSAMKEAGAVFLDFGFVSAQLRGSFEPAPSPKPRQNPKILAPNNYTFSSNALVHLPACAGGGFGVLIQITNQHGAGL
jgi:hypothetical protein